MIGPVMIGVFFLIFGFHVYMYFWVFMHIIIEKYGIIPGVVSRLWWIQYWDGFGERESCLEMDLDGGMVFDIFLLDFYCDYMCVRIHGNL